MNRPPVSAETRVCAVIGDPVRHSQSPRLHNAAYEALGLDRVYLAFEVPAGRGREAVRSIVDLGIDGLNVTMPHKEAAAAACDELTVDAAALRSVNTVVRRSDGTLLGASTDGDGFLRSLADAGVDPAGADVLVVGARGAARAVVQALGRVGARVTVAARRSDAADAAAGLAPAGRAVGLEGIAAALAHAALVVQATPLGMDATTLAFDPAPIGPEHTVCDLVYHPAVTPLLAAAQAAGATTVGGIGMLLHQAALAFELHTGLPAPLDAMRAVIAG